MQESDQELAQVRLPRVLPRGELIVPGQPRLHIR